MYPSKEDEFERIRSAYASELKAFISSRFREQETDDVLQDVWAAFARAHSVSDIEQPRAWLFQTARNRMVDSFRKESRQPVFDSLEEQLAEWPDAESNFDQEEFWHRFEQALETLPETQAEVFVRNELEGETLREIAQSMNEKLKTIISRKQYAKRRLRAELQDWYDEFFSG
ncbi:MAG: RNA polymerase sigma factor [Bacteroidota bacterium]